MISFRPYQRLSAIGVVLACAMGGPLLAWAEYQIQPLIRSGDAVGGAKIGSQAPFFVGSLNDRSQLILNTTDAKGGQLLIQITNGKPVVIAGAGGAAPGGTWPQNLFFWSPVSMNQAGEAVFGAPVTVAGLQQVGTFRVTYPSRPVSVVAQNGMSIDGSLRFRQGGAPGAVINNNGEVSFSAAVKDPKGVLLGYGVFFISQDGRLQPVALPGQTLPDGGTIKTAFSPMLNDSGVIAFVVIRQNDENVNSGPTTGRHIYLWERGTLTPVPVDSISPPPGTLLLGITGAWVNNHDRNVLVAAHLLGLAGHLYPLYRLSDGVPTPVALPGMPMPGGGKFLTLQSNGVGAANGAGEHPFLALLQDESTAAYRLGPDGQISLVLKSGASSSLGPITNVGQGMRLSEGIGLNTQGQVALTLRVGSGVSTVALLTPPAP